jgi:hypothetical protein
MAAQTSSAAAQHSDVEKLDIALDDDDEQVERIPRAADVRTRPREREPFRHDLEERLNLDASAISHNITMEKLCDFESSYREDANEDDINDQRQRTADAVRIVGLCAQDMQ